MAGKLSTLITIQNDTITQDAELNSVSTWADWKTVWAEPLQQSSREYYRLATTNAEVTKVFRIEYISGVTARQRIKHKSEYFEIIGRPENEGEIDRWLLISCKGLV